MRWHPHFAALMLLCLAGSPSHAQWKIAVPGWQFSFPRDHGNHPGFKTEWWYFTGNLRSSDNREWGYQLTFFRQGVIPPGNQTEATSRFIARNIILAHFALSDISGRSFRFAQKVGRGAFGEAGFDKAPALAWIEDWTCELRGSDQFRLQAAAAEFALALDLTPTKPPVLHGEDGLSRKAAGEGRASYYVSFTRMATSGWVQTAEGRFEVKGESWFDHEWATNQLDAHQTGWDWFSLQFDDGSEMMLFQIRTKDGGRDPFSAGTLIAKDGTTSPISDFELTPGRTWQSRRTKAGYPVEWHLKAAGFDLLVKASFDDQELVLDPISYWEGAIRATGTRDGKPVSAKGYLEMTGYGSPIVGLQATPGSEP